VAAGIYNLSPGRQTQPGENSLTELAGRLRNDSRRIAEQIEPRPPPPQLESQPFRPTARHPEGRPEYARHAAPQGLDPYGRSPPVRNSIEENVLDVPAFLRRRAN